ncbi:MAG: outer membrane lipoprotein chaperone LolA [Pseudomonadales bacterium]|nr:outer membrane lipoprotein chaperone LolA [Pseudomonadales bacterium]
MNNFLKRINRLMLAVVACFMVTQVNAGEHGAKVATDTLVKYLNAMTSMKASFRQWVEDSKKTKLQDVTGHVWVKRPGKFRWDTNEPYPQTIITDGKILWIYDKDLDQATRKSLDTQVGNTPALLLSGDPATIALSFDVTAYEYDKTGEWRFDLLPKGEESLFELLRVHFIDGRLRDMYLRDSLGQTTRIEFQTPVFNGDIKDTVFVFEPPEGVDVITDM